MTREEAIIEIERIKNHGWCRTEALDMAIAALSAQPERVQSYWRLSDYQNEADVANRMSDYISRRAAQEEIARRDTTDGTVKVFGGREVNEILANLPSAQPEQRWIPCMERLPDEDHLYLVTVDPRYVIPDGTQIDMLNWYEGNWWFTDIDERPAVFPDPVLAWMPLLEPWREE